WLSCFHFMYYDVLLSALPVFLLFTEPRRYLEPWLLAIVPLADAGWGDGLRPYYQPRLARAYPTPVLLVHAGYRHVWVLNKMGLDLWALLLSNQEVLPPLHSPDLPYDPFC